MTKLEDATRYWERRRDEAAEEWRQASVQTRLNIETCLNILRVFREQGEEAGYAAYVRAYKQDPLAWAIQRLGEQLDLSAPRLATGSAAERAIERPAWHATDTDGLVDDLSSRAVEKAREIGLPKDANRGR